jgi:hypothetical protein
MTGMKKQMHQEKAADSRWMAHGVCVEHPSLPWTEPLNHVPNVLVDVMADLCERCPVRAQCATYAVQTEVTAGWWAGMSFNGFDATHPPTAEDVHPDARQAARQQLRQQVRRGADAA